MNLRNRAYCNFLWPRARAKKKLELCIFWGKKETESDQESKPVLSSPTCLQDAIKVAVESISKVLNVVSQKVPRQWEVDDRATSLKWMFWMRRGADDLKSRETIRGFMDDTGG